MSTLISKLRTRHKIIRQTKIKQNRIEHLMSLVMQTENGRYWVDFNVSKERINKQT